MIKIVVVEPNKSPYVTEIENELHAFPARSDIILVCNEEGKLIGLPYNRTVYGEPIVGTFFLTTSNREGDFVSLSDEQVEWCLKVFG
jgi:hypothetical protein